jgi:hypothetical protein
MSAFLNGLSEFFNAVGSLFRELSALPTLTAFLVGLKKAFARCFRRPPRGGCCLQISPNVYVRPDPLIYDQYYLMAQGLAVTRDNPDIQIYDMSGNPVSPYGLTPNQDYRVRIRIWNNSYFAPAAGLPVVLSYLSFGIDIASTPVGVTSTNLGVKGSGECPAYANFVWRTPATPGHYCLKALLIWPDDANPNNNLGQKNTQVGQVASPALFSVPVQNQSSVRRHFDIEVDMYELPALPPCSEQPRRPGEDRYAESLARWKAALASQGYGKFPVTSAWTVTVAPAAFDLDAGQTIDIAISIELVSGAFTGTQGFNVHGFAVPIQGPRALVGGVTLLAQGS